MHGIASPSSRSRGRPAASASARCPAAPPRPTRSTASSRRPTRPPAPPTRRGRAELVAGDADRRLGRAARRDRHRRLRRLRAGARRGVRPGRRRGPDPLRLRRPRRDHDVPRPITGLRLRHVQPTGHYGCTGKHDRPRHSAWVGGATRDFVDVDALAMDAELERRLGWAARDGRPAGRPLRHDPAADRGRGPDDLRLLDGRRPRRPRRADGLQPPRRRHPDRRASCPAGRCSCSPTRPTRASSARRSSSCESSSNDESASSTTACRWRAPTGSTDGTLTALLQTREHRAT